MSNYIFNKSSDLNRPRNISKEEYNSAPYGTEYIYSPKNNPLVVYHFSGTNTYSSKEYNLFSSIKNTINYYKSNDELFQYENFYQKPATLYSLNSYHLGSGIEKGSVDIKMYVSGTKLSSLVDKYLDGVLYVSGTEQKAGIVLYREGFFVINHTGSLTGSVMTYSSSLNGVFNDTPKWIHSFISASSCMYYTADYKIKSNVSTNTTFVYAEKNELNHSNNATYIESGSYKTSTGSYHFYESEEIKIKKTNLSPFNSGSATFEKQTFITTIALYDEYKKLIAIANLANPVRKTENREFLFKLKLDI